MKHCSLGAQRSTVFGYCDAPSSCTACCTARQSDQSCSVLFIGLLGLSSGLSTSKLALGRPTRPRLALALAPTSPSSGPAHPRLPMWPSMSRVPYAVMASDAMCRPVLAWPGRPCVGWTLPLFFLLLFFFFFLGRVSLRQGKKGKRGDTRGFTRARRIDTAVAPPRPSDECRPWQAEIDMCREGGEGGAMDIHGCMDPVEAVRRQPRVH